MPRSNSECGYGGTHNEPPRNVILLKGERVVRIWAYPVIIDMYNIDLAITDAEDIKKKLVYSVETWLGDVRDA